MKSLHEYIIEAESQKKAIGHFNVVTPDMIQAIVRASQKLSQEIQQEVPVIIGFSEGERDFFGVQQSVEYIESIRNEMDIPIFSNADHTYSIERAEEAIDAGFDMVIIDYAEKIYEDNVSAVKTVVEYRNAVKSSALIEAELGFIGSGSNIKDTLPDGVSEATMTSPDQAKEFVNLTGLDILAPSVGNIHGMVKTGNPRLNPERVSQIHFASGVPLVLHGGSGSLDEDFTAVIKAGISMIHISTELRKIYRETLQQTLSEKPHELAPYKYLQPSAVAIEQHVYRRLKLFHHIA